MKISFIVPCFNSEKIIQKKIYQLKKKMCQFNRFKYEIIIIDDGSKDDTLKIIQKLKSKNIKIISNFKNLGKSSSIIKGIKKSKFNKIIIWDCDLPYFKYIRKLIDSLKNNNFVFINRRSPKSKLQSYNLSIYQISRLIISQIVCKVINYLFIGKYIGDTQAGLKGFDKPKNFKKIKFLSTKFFFDAELMILFNRSKLKMKSIHLQYKIYENSTIKIFDKENFIYLYELIKIIRFYRINKKNSNKIKLSI
jgi:glycosyltransferase involved in cell wall biosynthesis